MSLVRWSRLFLTSRALRLRRRDSALGVPVVPNLRFATASRPKREAGGFGRIEPALQRLDEDVRKYGRISGKDLREVLRAVGGTESITSSQSLLLLRCCGDLVPEELPSERTRLADGLWDALSDKGVAVDVSHYNALLRVYIENEHDFSADDFLRRMEERGIHPNRVTYQRMMWRLCQKGDVREASRVLETMREKNMPLTEAVMDALVLGHVRQNNPEGARSVLEAMSAAGLNPTSRTYGVLMSGPARRGDVEAVEKIIQECQQKEIFFSDRDLMGVLEEFAVGGHLPHVRLFLGKMQKSPGYNQDAINAVLRLVNRKLEDAALLVLKSMNRSDRLEDAPVYRNAFYVRHLIKARAPEDKILAHCKELLESGLAPKAFYAALEESLVGGRVELSLRLLEGLKSIGDPIRQHYFWPLLVNCHKRSKSDGTVEILKTMTSQYEMAPSVETLRDYVVPYLLREKSPNQVIDRLRESDVNLVGTVRSVVTHLLSEGETIRAAQVAGVYGVRTPLRSLNNYLIGSFVKEGDVDSFVRLVAAAYNDETDAKSQNDEDEENRVANRNARESLGRLIDSLVSAIPVKCVRLLPNVLRQFYERGLGTTAEWATRIQQRLGDSITAEIGESLAKLTSEDLRPVSHEIGSLPPVRRSPQQLLNLIESIENRGENPVRLKKQLLSTYIRNNDADKVEEWKNKLVESDFVLTGGTVCQIMDMYSQLGELDRALEYKKQLLDKEPDFSVDKYKILRLVQLQIKNEKFEDAIALVDQQGVKSGDSGESYLSNTFSWQILNSLAEKGDVEKVNAMFEKLKSFNYFELSNMILGPLIKVHLVKDDLKSAIDAFEKCCREYHFTPWKNELNKRLIMEEDANGLQKLTDLSTIIHGEVNSLYDLVFGFVECGRLKQARKILETPGMRIRNQRFISVCERYSQEGKVEFLEGLLEATRDLSHIDRAEIFYHLLNTYINLNDEKKASELWTSLQEDNVPPSDKFLRDLASFLKSKNLDVPFVVPEMKTDQTTNKKSVKAASDPVRSNHRSVIEKLIQEDKYEEVTATVMKLLQNKENLSFPLLRFVLSKLAGAGHLKMIENIGELLNEDQRVATLFDNKICAAVSQAGLTKGYLAEIEEKMKSASESDLQTLSKSLPIGGILNFLSKDNCYDKVKSIAVQFAEKGNLNPINALWMHNVLTDNREEGRRIWDEYLSNSPNILYRGILREAKLNGNVQLIENMVPYLEKNAHITPRQMGSIRSWHIDILITLNRVKEADELLAKVSKNGLPQSELSESTLKRLQQARSNTGANETREMKASTV